MNGTRHLHSAAHQRHTHQPAPTTSSNLSLFPSTTTFSSRGHSRRAHGGSDSVLTRPNAHAQSQSQHLQHRPRRPSDVPVPLSDRPVRTEEAAPPRHRSSHRRVQSHDLAEPVPFDQLPAAIQQKLASGSERTHRRAHSAAQPQYPSRTSSLNARLAKDWTPVAPPEKPSSKLIAASPPTTPRKTHHSKSSSMSSTKSGKTHRRKISLPPAYPGGEKIEIVILGDNARGLWEGNGVVMVPPSLPVQGPIVGKRIPSGHRKVKSVDEVRPGMTRLYTDF
ncbi:Hypothetical protein D9617_22g066660 [Elsinoe fawcettii]|nr:Hypothetical protein D9617_22g066660 [Elsinoe fawcettii]